MSAEIINSDTCGDAVSTTEKIETSVFSINGRGGYVVLNNNDVNLNNVDNTSDLNKPLSNAIIFALLSSVNWDSTYNGVYSVSTSWINQKVIDYNHINFLPLSGNSVILNDLNLSRNFSTWGSIVSAGIPLVDILSKPGVDSVARSLLLNNSSFWDDVFSHTQKTSGYWKYAADEHIKYLPLSGGNVTGIVSASSLKIRRVTLTGELTINNQPATQKQEYMRIKFPGNIDRYIPFYELN